MCLSLVDHTVATLLSKVSGSDDARLSALAARRNSHALQPHVCVCERIISKTIISQQGREQGRHRRRTATGSVAREAGSANERSPPQMFTSKNPLVQNAGEFIHRSCAETSTLAGGIKTESPRATCSKIYTGESHTPDDLCTIRMSF